ncbi:MAG: hypothetical protein JJE37_02025 [Methyloceanibacter sp.]|jgi:hypothetical protein|nr:hypothetical protein [Methyloceanibacter sp.]
MGKKQEAIRHKPSDYGIDMRDPGLAEALADLIKKGLVVDRGQRRFQNGKWRIVWVAVSPEERGKQYLTGIKL